jgi:hypothetical protein
LESSGSWSLQVSILGLGVGCLALKWILPNQAVIPRNHEALFRILEQ